VNELPHRTVVDLYPAFGELGLAPGPTEAYGGIKRLFLQSNGSFESQLEDEAQTLAAISRTADAQEGIKAFREKRSPNFQGR